MVKTRSEELPERRKGTRTSFVNEVVLTFSDGQADLRGDLRNISIFGMYIETERQVVVGSSCSIRIVIPAANSRLILDDIKGVVVRRGEHGLGIQFEAKLEWYVVFKIYTHFSKNGAELNPALLAEQLSVEEIEATLTEKNLAIFGEGDLPKN